MECPGTPRGATGCRMTEQSHPGPRVALPADGQDVLRDLEHRWQDRLLSLGLSRRDAQEIAEYTSAIGAMQRALRIHAAGTHRVLAPFGLSVPRHQILFLLAMYPDGHFHMKRLARWMMLGQAAVTQTVDRLERDGLVRRVPSSDDGRSYVVELTAMGRDVERRATGEIIRASVGLDGWNASDARQVTDAIRSLRFASGEFDDEPVRAALHSSGRTRGQ